MAFLNFPRPVDSVSIGSRSPADLLRIPVEFSEYTTSLASVMREDLGRIIRMNSSSPLTVTLQANGTNGANNFYPGEVLAFAQWGTGAVTFAAGANASLRAYNNEIKILGQNLIGFAIFCENNEWWLQGRLTTA